MLEPETWENEITSKEATTYVVQLPREYNTRIIHELDVLDWLLASTYSSAVYDYIAKLAWQMLESYTTDKH